MSAFEPQHARQSPRVLSDSMMDATIGSGGESGRLGGGVSGSQPVEFNHAINYVNKIKVSRSAIVWRLSQSFLSWAALTKADGWIYHCWQVCFRVDSNIASLLALILAKLLFLSLLISFFHLIYITRNCPQYEFFQETLEFLFGIYIWNLVEYLYFLWHFGVKDLFAYFFQASLSEQAWSI